MKHGKQEQIRCNQLHCKGFSVSFHEFEGMDSAHDLGFCYIIAIASMSSSNIQSFCSVLVVSIWPMSSWKLPRTFLIKHILCFEIILQSSLG